MNNSITIQSMLITQNSSLRDALLAIDKNAQGIIFVVDELSSLVGVLTDGDIRRLLLKGVALTEPVSSGMQKEFISRPIVTSSQELIYLLNDRVRHIPLVDENNIPVDYACLNRLHQIPIMEPSLIGNEIEYVTECIKTNWISSQGAFVRKFETMFTEYCGYPYALAVSNGTVALHLALVSLHIGPGDEVIVPDLTFAASINAIIYTGATPVIVDIHPVTWTIDPVEIEKKITSRTKAIMPVHLYGHPCHMDEITLLAQKYKLYIVEDCAEALGSSYKGKKVGTFGEVSTFSFFGNKTITTGEGGMVLFRNKEIYERAKKLRDHGMSPTKRYWHDEVGFNYRMTNMQGAIGVAQMERIDIFVNSKQRIAGKYNESLSKIRGIKLPPQAEWAYNSYWLYTLIIDQPFVVSRDEMMKKLLLNGVETRPVFYPLHEMPPYKQFSSGNYPVSIYVSKNGMSLPSSVNLTDQMLATIINALETVFKTRNLVLEL